MATGYDNRQGGRSTFAFTPANPSQSRPDAQAGGFRGISLEGGNSVAGAVSVAAQTNAGPVAGELGGFFNALMSPYVERQKKQQFVRGMVDQMSAVSGEEIRVNNKNPLNQIFGPSAYEEGAVFFAAKDAVNTWQNNMLADMDNLKRLPPEELSKVVAASFEQMNTGDQFTDLAVNTSLIEASGPLIGTVAKERYAWQQAEALGSWSKSANSAASAFQGMMVSLAKNSDKTDAGNLAANQAANNFLGAFVKPLGMDDQTYKKGLMGFYRAAAEAGNGYALTALKGAGVLNLLTDEERVRLEDVELKYGNRAQGRAALQFGEDLDRLNFNMTFGKVSSTEAMAQLTQINEEIKSRTGFDVDLFDYKEVTGVGKSVWTALKANLDKQEARKWQLEDRAAQQSFQLQLKEKEASDEAAAVQLAYATGRIKTATAAGVGSSGNYDLLAQADFAAKDFTRIIRAYNNDQWVSGLVRDNIQAQISSSIGQEYNKDFEQGAQTFAALNKTKPAVAMAYYGDLYTPMANYQRLIGSGRLSPTQAFQQAFSNPAQYAGTPELDQKGAKKVADWIDGNRGGSWFGLGRSGLNTSGKQALTNAMARQIGVLSKNSDLPIDALVPNLYTDLVRSGAYEDYGKLGWTNKVGTTNLGKMLNLQQDEADEVVTAVVDRELRRTGFADGADGDNYDVRRIRDSKGNVVLAVTPYDEDTGAATTALIPFSMFKQQADTLRAGRVATVKPGRAYSGVNPYRRVPGETGAQRVARINREVAAGADPVKH